MRVDAATADTRTGFLVRDSDSLSSAIREGDLLNFIADFDLLWGGEGAPRLTRRGIRANARTLGRPAAALRRDGRGNAMICEVSIAADQRAAARNARSFSRGTADGRWSSDGPTNRWPRPTLKASRAALRGLSEGLRKLDCPASRVLLCSLVGRMA